jgi:hypothetical protein
LSSVKILIFSYNHLNYAKAFYEARNLDENKSFPAAKEAAWGHVEVQQAM